MPSGINICKLDLSCILVAYVSWNSKTSLKPAKCLKKKKLEEKGENLSLCLQIDNMWSKNHEINVSWYAAKSEQNINFE